MVHGFGDTSGLRTVDTPVGRVGALICWENYMPLARYSLYAQGVEIYVAPTYDTGDGWICTMRHIALEGRLVADPLHREAGILYADIDVALVAPARRALDVTGHYARPDIFELQVRCTPATAVRYIDE